MLSDEHIHYIASELDKSAVTMHSFKLMYLQDAGMLLLGGAALFTFGFLPFLCFSMYQQTIRQ